MPENVDNRCNGITEAETGVIFLFMARATESLSNDKFLDFIQEFSSTDYCPFSIDNLGYWEGYYQGSGETDAKRTSSYKHLIEDLENEEIESGQDLYKLETVDAAFDKGKKDGLSDALKKTR